MRFSSACYCAPRCCCCCCCCIFVSTRYAGQRTALGLACQQLESPRQQLHHHHHQLHSPVTCCAHLQRGKCGKWKKREREKMRKWEKIYRERKLKEYVEKNHEKLSINSASVSMSVHWQEIVTDCDINIYWFTHSHTHTDTYIVQGHNSYHLNKKIEMKIMWQLRLDAPQSEAVNIEIGKEEYKIYI